MALPLSGVRVLAVEQYGAGPFGSSYLADLGAEVIKIENPAEGGDVGRHVGPYFNGPGDSQFFQTFNRNKKSVVIDLKHPQGWQVFRDLARTAEGVLDNLSGDKPAMLGLTYDTLKDVNPRIVCAHPSLTPSQLYRTGDGWLFVMCNKEKFWGVLAGELGHPEWATDPEVSTYKARLASRARVTRMLDAAFMQKTTVAWLEQLKGKVPAAPVNDIAQALQNPFVAERVRKLREAGVL